MIQPFQLVEARGLQTHFTGFYLFASEILHRHRNGKQWLLRGMKMAREKRLPESGPTTFHTSSQSLKVLPTVSFVEGSVKGEASAWRPSFTAHPSCVCIFLSHHPARPSFSSSLSGDLLLPWTLIDSFFLLSWPLELSSSILVVLEFHTKESAHGTIEHFTSLLVAYTIEKFPSYQ